MASQEKTHSLEVRPSMGDRFPGAYVVLVTASHKGRVRQEVILENFVQPSDSLGQPAPEKIAEANSYAEIVADQLGIDHTKLEV